MYRLSWKSKTSDRSGNGEYVFASKKAAQAAADRANEKNPGLHYYVESKPTKK